MALKNDKKEELLKKDKFKKAMKPSANDGMNTPVRDHSSEHTLTENEKAMFKQAENPLGNPDNEE
jgi:hypothetical protein